MKMLIQAVIGISLGTLCFVVLLVDMLCRDAWRFLRRIWR